MRDTVVVVCLMVLCSVGSLSHARDTYPPRDAKECSPRTGLPNFLAKLQKGDDVVIGYLGGSITDQKGWRVLSEQWFQKQYPNTKITGINAALGGTGSDLGLFRLQSEVLDHKPDLLFVEFAVNDHNTPTDWIIKAMEGIVRQTWTQFPDCDICFFYTMTQRHLDELLAGKMQRTASVMEAVADHYGIPSIHVGVEIAALEKQGKLLFKAKRQLMTRVAGDELNVMANVQVNNDGKIPYSGDGVHPYLDTGHQIYMNIIARNMPAIQAAGKVESHSLPAPLDKNNWEKAKVVTISQNLFSGNVKQLDPNGDISKRFAHRIPGIWEALPGSSMSFQFKGAKVMIYDLLGPGCGQVQITIDGKSRKVVRLDSYSNNYRLTLLGVGNYLEPTKIHTVEIKVLDETFDKAKILEPRHPGAVTKEPGKFEPINWYPCAIMLVGDMVTD